MSLKRTSNEYKKTNNCLYSIIFLFVNVSRLNHETFTDSQRVVCGFEISFVGNHSKLEQPIFFLSRLYERANEKKKEEKNNASSNTSLLTLTVQKKNYFYANL